MIGGVEIPFDKHLVGHSDADVLLHAVTDALLGSAALGDIGGWFPDTDPQYRGAASSVFVERGSRRLSVTPKAGSAPKSSFRSLWGTGMLLGFGFALLQTWLWYDLILAGSTQASGLYESLFFGLTWVHAAHVLVGLFLLVWAFVGSKLGRYGPGRRSFVSNAALFWHFVGIVWLFLFLGFFVF